MKTWTIREVLQWTAKDLARRGVGSPRLDAEVLLAYVLGTDRLDLYLDLDRPLAEPERTAYRELIARRRAREPVAYITGQKEFWSLPFAVSPDVLVPRPDTEILVEEALELLPSDADGLTVDVGTGSGCVALAVATERPRVRALAIDVDRGAAAIAAHNARSLCLSDRVAVVVGDLLAPVASGSASLVVANLPYVPSEAIPSLEPEIARWEPRCAVDGGVDGLREVSRLVESAADVVAPGGALALEVGHGQSDRVVSLLGPGWALHRVRKDYGGVQRVVVAKRR